MHITLLGYVCLPLCVLYALHPVRLLQLVLGLGVLDAAGLVTVGNLGLMPALVPAALFIAFVALQLLLGARYDGARSAVRLIWPFLVVAVWGLVGSVLLPDIFAGRVMVHPQKVPAFLPLEPDGSNRNQDLYLLVNTAVLLFCSLHASRRGFATNYLVNTFLATGFAVAAICWWELASKLAGVPFPDKFFHSNPGYAQLSDQSLGLVPRINGPFTEPSAVGDYMAGILGATLWMMLQGHRAIWLRVLCVIALVTILLSTSTTGIVVLVVLIAGTPLYAIWRRSSRLLAWVSGAAIAAALAIGVVFTVGPTLFPNMDRAVQEIVQGTLEKQHSRSYDERTQADLDSLGTITPTWGLGVGWGSNRSSSLLPGLLANLGVFGTLGIVAFGWRLARVTARARRTAAQLANRRVIDAAVGCLGGHLLAAMISGPTISDPGFFVMLALLIGTVAHLEAPEPARIRPLVTVAG